MRVCKTCLKPKDDACFTLYRGKNGKSMYRRKVCDSCRSAQSSAKYHSDPVYRARLKQNQRRSQNKHREKIREKDRNRLLVWKYGITLAQKNKLLELQGGRCAVCRSSNPGARGWQTDHDQKYENETGKVKVRGIICQPCNLTLGVAKEDHDRLNQCRRFIRFHNRLIMGGTKWLDLWPQGGMVGEEITAQIGAL
jgi:Recombination endonuclease VII